LILDSIVILIAKALRKQIGNALE